MAATTTDDDFKAGIQFTNPQQFDDIAARHYLQDFVGTDGVKAARAYIAKKIEIANSRAAWK